jgi:hypothetical protein
MSISIDSPGCQAETRDRGASTKHRLAHGGILSLCEPAGGVYDDLRHDGPPKYTWGLCSAQKNCWCDMMALYDA